MKKLLALLLLFILLPVTAYAHSGLSTSTPAEGESLEVSPADIRFEFDTPIQQGEMTLTNEAGEKIELADVSVSELELIGQLNEELPNGPYTVDWSVISQDSHEVAGTLIFNVAAEEAVEETTEGDATEAAPEEDATEETSEATETEETVSPAEEQAEGATATADDSATGSSLWVTLIIVAILAVAATTFFVMARRK